jgi:hypothetical protein
MQALLRLFLTISLTLPVTAFSGVGEGKAEIRARYPNIIFSVRETKEVGPVHEEFDHLGRKIEVHYKNHLSSKEVFHGIKSVVEARQMLNQTQPVGEWKLTQQNGKVSEWASGPLRAQYEKEVLRVFLEEAPKER